MYMYLTVNKMYMNLTEKNVHLFDLTKCTCIINKQNVHIFDCKQNIHVFDYNQNVHVFG